MAQWGQGDGDTIGRAPKRSSSRPFPAAGDLLGCDLVAPIAQLMPSTRTAHIWIARPLCQSLGLPHFHGRSRMTFGYDKTMRSICQSEACNQINQFDI